MKKLGDVSLSADSEIETGSDAVITVNGSEGDFLKHLNKVTVSRDGGDPVIVLTKSAGGESGNKWYELVGESGSAVQLRIKGGQFQTPGEYTVALKSTYYDKQTVKFNVKQAADSEDAEAAPAAKSIRTSGSTYLLTFDADEADAAKYLDKVQSVRVGSAYYTKGLLGCGGSQYQAANDPAYGGKYQYLKLGKDGFSDSENTKVEIRSEGYKTLTFEVTPDGNLTGSKPAEPEKKEMTAKPSDVYEDGSYGYYQLNGLGSQSEWFGSITAVSVNGTELTKDSNAWYGTKNVWTAGSTSLVLPKGILKAGDNTVTVSADGYKDVTWTITKTTNPYGGQNTYTVK